MQTLKINIPTGFKVKSFDETTNEVHFEPIPKNVQERIKTFPDVLSELKIDSSVWNNSVENLRPDEIAYKQLKLIAQVLNEGWQPNWEDSNESKYYPWFEMGSPSGVGFSYDDYAHWRTFSSVGSRLCFKSGELAKYAGTQFESIYKKFLTLNK